MPTKNNENMVKKEDKLNVEIKTKQKKNVSIDSNMIKVKLVSPNSYSISYNKVIKDKKGHKFDISIAYNFKADEPIEIEKECYEKIEKGIYGDLKFEVIKGE